MKNLSKIIEATTLSVVTAFVLFAITNLMIHLAGMIGNGVELVYYGITVLFLLFLYTVIYFLNVGVWKDAVTPKSL